MVHGTGRDGASYFDRMVTAATDAQVLDTTEIIAPLFQTKDDDPDHGDAYWTNGDATSWKDGGDSVDGSSVSSFTVMDEILAKLSDRSAFPNLRSITLTGHSAGGQFTQRYAAGGDAPDDLEVPVRFVPMNPSSYLYFDRDRPVDVGQPERCSEYNDYKYGLDHRNAYMSRLDAQALASRYTARHVTYVLGEADTTDSHGMDDSCMAMAQGPNRLARGKAYFEQLHREHPDAQHELVTVANVGHDGGAMFDSPEGRQVLFGDATPAPTTTSSTAAPTSTTTLVPTTTSTTTTDSTPPSSGECTVHVPNPDDLGTVQPGDVVCFDGDLSGDRLRLTKGGTAEAPVTYLGKDGQAVGGIDIEGSFIAVDGYTMDGPSAPGVELTGDHLTLQNTHVSNPTGGDGDGIRFFGTDLVIRHNVVHGTSNDNGHADCMQTFASDTPASHDVLIEGNRCEDIDNMGLMAEGPNDGEGDGEGHTYNITLKDNYYLSKQASQEIMVEDVQHLTLTGNTFDGGVDHAIGLDIGSTDAHIDDNNAFSPDISCKVGIDDTSRDGYQGPEPECGP
ncbi:right-handed parallel beta-helix repeat-containing protein [Labedaea rhizosphaerae]|uniref:right-handed parallel beta-helix repeat-containing protein n=1 Tax=Labedaea rhizosphaerae TaxID=598644 RepID=UPI001FB6C31F|nr:right-handed parallel beta-helix repeat-containing protein [Labedaea rhizosphaerae]